jgi:hypothetical protein
MQEYEGLDANILHRVDSRGLSYKLQTHLSEERGKGKRSQARLHAVQIYHFDALLVVREVRQGPRTEW